MVLVNIARNPAPGGAVAGHFSAKDGVKIRFARWKATAPERRGTVCLFTGRTEFIEKYFEVISDLRRRGFSVAIMDWRGQGGSDHSLRNPLKGHVKRFSDYEEDVTVFMKQIVLPDCPPPYFALAHSMGGLVMLNIATNKNSWFDRMVLVSPMFRLSQSLLPISQETAHFLSEVFAMFGLGDRYVPGGSDVVLDLQPFEVNKLTSDRTRYERTQAILDAAPELGLASPTIHWLKAACRSMKKAADLEFASKVSVPILMIGAGSDRIVSLRAIEDMSLRLKLGHCVIIPEAKHEILHECDELRLQFWAAFDAYIPGSHDLPIRR